MQEDIWIPTACSICLNLCGILVHRVNGVVVKIEGNPKSPAGMGKLCPKGLSGIMLLYDPYRVKTPLKRTNPEKGIGVDPKWVEITWEEALDIITERLKKINKEDSRKLMLAGTVAASGSLLLSWNFAAAFGTPNLYVSGAGTHCGNGEHLFSCLLHASWIKIPDYDYCNYLLIFGCHVGFAAYYSFPTVAQRCSDARIRGMKVVVVDPMCNAAGEKSDEWIPIKPGTDAALALAIINILINDLEIYDADLIKKHTNGPYLIKPDGYYIRDEDSGKPLIWDPIEERAKTYDDSSIKDFALEGIYNIGGLECKPAFSLLKEHVRKWTKEEASKITTIPADTIERIATEFGKAARIGSTIVIDGKKLPLRPAAVVYFKGAQGHKHSMLTSMAIDLLNVIVGSCDVPGGILGNNSVCLGYPETGEPYFTPTEGPDGIMVTGNWFVPEITYPPREITKPRSHTLLELFPLARGTYFPILTIPDPKKWGLDYNIDMLINIGSNMLMSLGNPSIVAETLKKIPFIASFNLNLDETTDFSDIVLPDTCYLERLEPYPTESFLESFPGGMGEWGWQLRQSVVDPVYGGRNVIEVFMEISERLGIIDDFYMAINLMGRLKEPYKLNPDEKYKWEEIVDRWCKSLFGPEHGVEWFKKEGVIKWEKRVEEVYWRPFLKARVPIYFEYFRKVGEDLKKVSKELGIDLDISDYQPLPDWKPCPSHEVDSKEYDFFAFYYRVAWHTLSWTMENPWLNEIAELDPWTHYAVINKRVAENKGIKDGDSIWIESIEGNKIKGVARLSEAIHPEALGIASNGGHWADGLPIAKNKGPRIAELQPINLKYTDIPTNNLDLCVKVKIYKNTV